MELTQLDIAYIFVFVFGVAFGVAIYKLYLERMLNMKYREELGNSVRMIMEYSDNKTRLHKVITDKDMEIRTLHNTIRGMENTIDRLST